MGEYRGKVKNHYVPRLYLKNFASSDQNIEVYRTLVSNENVPLWKKTSLKGISYHQHLYTRTELGKEISTLEDWFDSEYESPGNDAIQKVISEQRLKPSDWSNLVRFLAAQDLRTPARFIEHKEWWSRAGPELMEKATKEALAKHESKNSNPLLNSLHSPNTDGFPLHFTKFEEDGQQKLKVATVNGRKLWLWVIQHLLSKAALHLHKHTWSILKPSKGFTWFTSDDPVIKLNFRSEQKYSFKGGWGSQGTAIFLPLSPEHLLYTRVGTRPPRRGKKLNLKQTEIIRKTTAEHAHRFIFSSIQDAKVSSLRPRTVSRDLYLAEKEEWQRWHDIQSKAELDF